MTDQDAPSPLAEALTRVQEELADARRQRVEERFIWVLVVLGLLDILLLGDMKNITAPLVILAIELIGLTVLAKRMGISSAAVVLDRLTSAVAHKG
jgi:hypothetical protein